MCENLLRISSKTSFREFYVKYREISYTGNTWKRWKRECLRMFVSYKHLYIFLGEISAVGRSENPSLSLSENAGLRKKKNIPSTGWSIFFHSYLFLLKWHEMAINWNGFSQIFNAKRQELEAAQPLWPLAMLRPCYGNRWKSKGFPFPKKNMGFKHISFTQKLQGNLGNKHAWRKMPIPWPVLNGIRP